MDVFHGREGDRDMRRSWIKAGDRVKTQGYGTGTVNAIYVVSGDEYADVWLDHTQRDHHPHVCWTGDLKREAR